MRSVGANALAPGSPFYLFKGTVLYNELVRFVREQYELYDKLVSGLGIRQ